ncbi:hypothetical protein B0H10DRAFT_1819442 [Mycena sp. CBHHK59/15]|nr:hypothetical protein B0H10DRAFT_1819442 [Mycena sp. CBHHK59/15]
MCCLYLLPYSPVELGFSKMKLYIQQDGQQFRAATEVADDKLEVLIQLHNAVYSITPQDAEGWFRHSGYF